MDWKKKEKLLLTAYTVFLIVTAPIWIILECVKKMD
jgi:hypothetical protein